MPSDNNKKTIKALTDLFITAQRKVNHSVKYREIAKAFTNYFIVQKNIDRHVLTREQEEYLLKLAQTGDKKAFRELMEANKWLVERAAFIYYKHDQDIQFKILLEKGFSALQKAIAKYNTNKDYKFSIYAFWWIVGSLGIDTGLIDLSSIKDKDQ